MVTEAIINHSVTKSQLMDQLQCGTGESVSATPSGEEGRWVIRYPLAAEDATPVDIATELHHISDQVQIVSNSMVGSQVGQELIDQGGLALLICLLSILAYLSFRFEWRLASGALLALLHDVILVLGFFAITQMEFNLTVFAAVLAVLGYSLNDSIIISIVSENYC